MDEDNSLTGRVIRYARVGGAVSNLAAKAASGRLLGGSFSHSKQAADLQTALGGLKGPLMKVAQILATVPDLLPSEYTREFIKLQCEAPSMGRSFVKRRMAAELGASWQLKFKEFSVDASKAASLGQVHKALSHANDILACKIQYPDMESAVEADLAQLKFAFSIYQRYDKAIDPSEIHMELSERLREELDYTREARNIGLYRYMLGHERMIHIPTVIEELSTKRLLTMSWLDGEPLMDFISSEQAVRNKVAKNMFRAWYLPFYNFGIIHGDPHLGNYTIRSDGSVNLLDFGCIRVFRPNFVTAVIDLFRALRDNDMDLAVKAYETWGFTKLDRQIIAILNQWAQFLYGPLLEDKVRTIQEDKGTAYGTGIAAKVHTQLREIGGIQPPREFVLMDRAAVGLGSVFTHLKAKINWHRMFHQLIDEFDEAKLAKEQLKILKKVGIPIDSSPKPENR